VKNGTPVVLIASVSPHEERFLEVALENTGWDLLPVGDAEEATRRLDGAERGAVLVIDAGLLQMGPDPQWRVLLALRPELGTVVRCLIPQSRRLQRKNGTTFEVHPDDVEGLRDAVHFLAGSGFPPDPSTFTTSPG